MMSDGQLLARWTEKFTNTHTHTQKKAHRGGISWFMTRFHNLSFTGCQGMHTPPFSEGTRTKMLTHFLHHVTLIRWTLLAQELNTLRSRAAVTSQPASCFFREAHHVTGISGDGGSRWAARASETCTQDQIQTTNYDGFWIGNACVQGFATTPETLSFYECELIFAEWDAPRRVCESVFTNVATGVCGTEMLWQICILDIYFPFTVSSVLISNNFTNGGASRCRYGDNAGVCKWRRRRDIN